MSTASPVVQYAVFGALPDGNAANAKAFDVTTQLQHLFTTSTTVACSIANFGDPAPSYKKHFAAIVTRDGTNYSFACEEGQSIDFAQGGTAPAAQTMTVKFAVYGALPGGSSNEAVANDVTSVVQWMLNRSGGPVLCSNASFGDPAVGNEKHFAAVVNRGGVDHYFACQEGQTIDFSQGGNP
jgi:hypothetical protein